MASLRAHPTKEYDVSSCTIYNYYKPPFGLWSVLLLTTNEIPELSK